MLWRQAWIVLVLVATLAPPGCCCELPRAGERDARAEADPAPGCRSCHRPRSEQGTVPCSDQQRCECPAHGLTSAATKGQAVAARAAFSAWLPATSSSSFLVALAPAPSGIRKASTARPPARSLSIRFRTLLL
jgi:hypothetical protein